MTKKVTSRPVSLEKVKISDSFWSEYIELVRKTVIPYQWEALNDNIPNAEPSYAVRNFKIAAGLEIGEFGGFVFQDSDVAKWLEAVGYSLQNHPDPKLEEIADGMIEIIEKAQQSDGYLDTYYILKEPGKKWTNLQECHELYVAGHMIEAAVAYYKATEKRKLLEVMCRFADNIDSVFGPEPEKLKGYDGHQEIELALVKLYQATRNEKYLNLSKFFIDERGKEPNFLIQEWEKREGYSHWTKGKVSSPDLEYHQAHKPVREQTVAVGHSVRAVYMYTAMADIARETGDNLLFEACKRLWNNIVNKQMYITGGIGSTHHGEAFSFDYDLPNDTVYAESCASIGLIFFAHRMLQLEQDNKYADIMERALYNTVLGAMSRDGKHFFYVNPLEVWPEACEKNPGKKHVKAVRQKWFGCACCPPNIARLFASLNQYIYSYKENTVYTHLYIGGEAEIELESGSVVLKQESGYPWNGKIKFSITSVSAENVSLAFRIPGWCKNWTASINGNNSERLIVENGYVHINENWKDGDEIELIFEIKAELIQANPKVRANGGKVAIQRGPLVYCLEEADNGENLSALSIDATAVLTSEIDSELGFDNAFTIKGKAFRSSEENWENILYSAYSPNEKQVEFKAVPYFMWGNRSNGEMQVWVNRR